MHRLKKILLWTSILFICFSLTGFFVLPPLLKSIALKKFSDYLHRDVFIQKIDVNPYTLSLRINGLTIKDRSTGEICFSFNELFINLEGLSILKRALICYEIRLTRPFIQVIRRQDLSYNFSDLLGNKEPKKQERSRPFLFSLNNIKIVDGSIDFIDDPNRQKHTVRNMNITLPFMSNISYYINSFVQPLFSANIDGTPYSIQGKTKIFADSRETSLDVNINNLNIPLYLSYLPLPAKVKVTSGQLDTKGKISFIRQKNKPLSLKFIGDITLKTLKVDNKDGDPLLRLPELKVSLDSAEPIANTYHVSSLVVESPEVHLQRLQTGELNINSLFSKEKEQTAEPPGKESPIPLVLNIDRFQVTAGKIAFMDYVPSQPVTLNLEEVNLKAENISTEKGNQNPFSFSCLLNKKGVVSITGEFGSNPLSLNAKVDAANIGLIQLQPYFTDKVKVTVTNGSISVSGDIAVSSTEEKKATAVFNGNASLSNFASVDKVNGDNFLKWKSFSLNEMNLRYNPTDIQIKRISFNNFFARLILNQDKTVNLQSIFEGKESESQLPRQKQEKPVSPSEKQTVNIGSIALGGGTIEFSDRSIEPEYSMTLSEFTGTVSGVSSATTSTATVDVKGKLNKYAPFEVKGRINPLRDDLFVDLKARLTDLDLSPFTPYAGKYIGYTINKGQLSFDLSYLIEKKKLDSKNKVTFDQFTFGDKVESPEAIKQPVKLAVSLLKDRNGVIKLDLPVTGNLDDPTFSVTKIVFQIIENLLVKAATSPFALLGSAFGGGEELSYIEFIDGSSAVTETVTKKLDTLVKALSDRPSLKLDIEGHVDVEKDREGLKLYQLNKKLKVQKLKEMVKRRLPEIPIDEITIESQEYERFLRMAYKAEKFPKPRTVLGLAKDLPAPEMERLMKDNIEVTDNDLRSIAVQRSQQVKDYILASGQIEPDRLFIIEPKALQPEKKENVSNSRVDFRLK